jgi:hypothetical protein
MRAHRTGHNAEEADIGQGMIERRSCLVSPFENAIIAWRTMGMHTS